MHGVASAEFSQAIARSAAVPGGAAEPGRWLGHAWAKLSPQERPDPRRATDVLRGLSVAAVGAPRRAERPALGAVRRAPARVLHQLRPVVVPDGEVAGHLGVRDQPLLRKYIAVSVVDAAQLVLVADHRQVVEAHVS